MGGELGRLVEREALGELQACLSMPGPAPQPASPELLTGDFPCGSYSGGSPLSQTDTGLQGTLLHSCLVARGGVGNWKMED